MTKRKADELELQERETKKTKVDDDQDKDMLLFLYGEMKENTVEHHEFAVWHFRAFWIWRWNLPQDDSWRSRTIRQWAREGDYDDIGQMTQEDRGAAETLAFLKHGGELGPGYYRDELFAEVDKACKSYLVKDLAKMVRDYLSVYGETIRYRFRQLNTTYNIAPAAEGVLYGLGKGENKHEQATCKFRNEYNECSCKFFTRRVYIPDRVGFEHGKVVKP